MAEKRIASVTFALGRQRQRPSFLDPKFERAIIVENLKVFCPVCKIPVAMTPVNLLGDVMEEDGRVVLTDSSDALWYWQLGNWQPKPSDNVLHPLYCPECGALFSLTVGVVQELQEMAKEFFAEELRKKQAVGA